MKTRQNRRRASYGRRCVRCWFRWNGRVIRMLHTSDYRPCKVGGDPRLFVKLLAHSRYAPGVRLSGDPAWWGQQVLPVLVAGQWVELVIDSGVRA